MTKERRRAEAFSGTLPEGTATTDASLYVRAWRHIGEVIGAAIGERVRGYEPGISFTHGYDMPMKFALPFYKALTGSAFDSSAVPVVQRPRERRRRDCGYCGGFGIRSGGTCPKCGRKTKRS